MSVCKLSMALTVWVACLGIAHGATITYTVQYSQATGNTTLYNDVSSEPDLQFWTTTGPNVGVELSLAPGETVTINSTGDIVGGTHLIGWRWPYRNIKKGDKKWKVHNNDPLDRSVSVYDNTTGASYHLFKYCDWTPELDGDHCIEVRGPGRWNATDCDFEALIEDTSAIINSYDWPGAPSQASMQLLDGHLRSVDDTDKFVSVLAGAVVTGCRTIPEPAALAIWALFGAIGASVTFRCRVRAPDDA